MIRQRCYVCLRTERLVPFSRRLRPVGSFRSGTTIYACGNALCREVVAELCDRLAEIAPTGFVRSQTLEDTA